MGQFESMLKFHSENQQKYLDRRAELEEAINRYNDKIVIYGYGNLGQHIARKIKEIFEVKHLSFIDSYKQTNLKVGLYNIEDVENYIVQDSLIIVAMYSLPNEFKSIKDALIKRGYKNIISVWDTRFIPEIMQYGLVSCDISKLDIQSACCVYEMLYDVRSQQTYFNLFQYILSIDKTNLIVEDTQKQYMPLDLYIFNNSEHILDCGAFNGDTMRDFWEALSPCGFSSYIAVEPDSINRYNLLQSVKSDFPNQIQDKIRVIPAAVSDCNGEIHFSNYGTSFSSVVDNNETDSIPVIRLDDEINTPITLIKMDIEGFEMKALRGAKKIIQKNKPLMAICGYHRFEDLWEIPLYLHELLPDHKILLRNYVGLIEYVFYAIPPERVITHE